jgi:hypothetical protein
MHFVVYPLRQSTIGPTRDGRDGDAIGWEGIMIADHQTFETSMQTQGQAPRLNLLSGVNARNAYASLSHEVFTRAL